MRLTPPVVSAIAALRRRVRIAAARLCELRPSGAGFDVFSACGITRLCQYPSCRHSL